MPLTGNANDIDIREFYESIVDFAHDEKAQERYYSVMDSPTGRLNRDGSDETVRDRILKAYAMLFCEEAGLEPGECAGVDEVADTADRLYIGDMGYDPDHWYRMKYHFPVIDEDNYDRFAALVISDMNAGPLHEAAMNDGDTLVVGEADPLHMTPEQRRNQTVRSVALHAGGEK